MTAADGLVAVLGEGASVHVGTAVFPLIAAFREPYVGYTLAGVPIERPNPTALFRQADWASTGAHSGDTVVMRGITYTVVTSQPAGGGVEVTLRG